MWKPPVRNTQLAKKIENKIDEITFLLKDRSINKDTYGLLSGQCGQLLFYNYNSLFKNDSSLSDLNEEIIINIFENIGESRTASFGNGLAGILWTFDHLIKSRFLELEEDVFDETNKIFYKNLQSSSYLLDYDYLHGSFGIFKYLTDRGNFMIENANQFLRLFDDYCSSKKDKYGWEVIVDTNSGLKGYCFGLAHGTPSAIIILLNYYEQTKNEKALEIAMKHVNHLYSVQRKGDYPSNFPCTITENKPDFTPRLAWCYGDLGCAQALYRYGKIINDQKMISEAVNIMIRESEKRCLDENSIRDGDLCHGTISAAHLFARLYNLTNIENFRIASEYWYEQTLNIATHSDGLVGYKHYNGISNTYEVRYGLLEGITGIGLSFISAISNVEPKWDKCLLLS